MVDYQKLYYIMVDASERALVALNQQNYGVATKILITAERRATEFAVAKSGHMNKTILLTCSDAYHIGMLMMLFELQTAYAGELLGINAYDQPGVEQGKKMTYALLGKPGFEELLKELEITGEREII